LTTSWAPPSIEGTMEEIFGNDMLWRASGRNGA
jgi:hypothetical protein